MANNSSSLHTQIIDDIAIYSLDGNIIDSQGTTLLKEEMQHALGNGCKHVILNLLNVDFVNSTGLGAFLQLYSIVQRQHGTMYLVQVSAHVLEILKITQAITIFPVFNTLNDALAEIKGAKGGAGNTQTT